MNIIADLLRSTVSNVMSILLLFSLAQPKFKKGITNLIMLGVIVINSCICVTFYLSGNLTKLAKVSVIWFLLLYIVLKPLFSDNLMQWLFTLITVINVYVAIVALSYPLCEYLPYPQYAVTVLRFFFFLAVILMFRRWLRTLYRQAVIRWRVFILFVTALFVNLVYYFIISKDIEETLKKEFVPIFLLVILAITAYICIFYFLMVTSSEYALKEENIRLQSREELMQIELSSYEEFIDSSKQHRHDLRHHNALLRELLTQENVKAALAYLNEYDNSIAEVALHQYCSNPVGNAILGLYEHRAQASHIEYVVNANIPEVLPLKSPELGGLLSNLLENAWIACRCCTDIERFIIVTVDTTENQLFIEVKNSVQNEVRFIDSLPVSDKEGGGTGVRSMMHIVKEHSGMCRFKQSNNEFTVQIVLSL